MAEPTPPNIPDSKGPEPKKETVRINIPIPGAASGSPELPIKRDTVRISIPGRPASGPIPPPPPAPASPSRPFIPPPPAPKPPGASAPAVPPAPPAGIAPVTMKAATPKKETARIQLPPEPKPLPKATVRMQQTQPLIQQTAPAPLNRPAFPIAPPSSNEGAGQGLAIGALAASVVALGIQLWTYLS